MHAEPETTGAAAAPRCDFRGAPRAVLYAGLRGRPFEAPRAWDIRRCSSAACGILGLDPMLLEGQEIDAVAAAQARARAFR